MINDLMCGFLENDDSFIYFQSRLSQFYVATAAFKQLKPKGAILSFSYSIHYLHLQEARIQFMNTSWFFRIRVFYIRKIIMRNLQLLFEWTIRDIFLKNFEPYLLLLRKTGIRFILYLSHVKAVIGLKDNSKRKIIVTKEVINREVWNLICDLF